ncbi:hypothetical protein [Microbacterium sp. UCD-TDU]|uniref:hypothetical protein n=1 Tax=Microbacterium sp. UCD-TDU TaxID=1247714 RepID=UPI0003473864|nr:hypothetical protein [Microbacterium sp. UCD-TDU]EYT59771.1 hypothetical protein D514_0111770 [Microbacterium sp. UCD-TDU]
MTATTPLFITCPRCSRQVLEVRADWQLGVLIGTPRLDAVQLDPTQITACILTGLELWQVHTWAGKTVTSRRSRWWPTEPVAGTTAPRHACGRVWDAPALDLAPDKASAPEKCPF